jgi:16S rRNA (guanine527-N7)-methyltransferase
VSGRDLRDRIRRRAKHAELQLEPTLLAGLEAYYQLLAKWNAKVNLTAFPLSSSGEDEAVDRLLIEPVAAARYLPPMARTLLDAGSGGGSPAIPLKLAAPAISLRMVESKTRKAVFLREAVRVLNLDHTVVETSRFEELLARPELHEALDVLTVRAVRIEPKVLMTLQAFLRPKGQLLLFRAATRGDVIESFTPPLVWKATYPLIGSLRSRLVVLEKVSVGR